MINNNIELSILIKDRPITEYFHRGQIFVEGRAGSEYALQIRNNNPYRVETIISVDGLSVTDGKPAGDQSSGYVIERYEVVKIPGWTLDNNNVAKFVFSGKQESYATQATGDNRNNGVIGAMTFVEKYASYHPVVSPMPWNPQYISRSWGGSGIGSGVTPSSSAIYNCSTNSTGMSMGIAASASSAISQMHQTANIAASGYADEDVDQSLGTGFGKMDNFSVTNVTFSRGDMLSYQVIFYDEARGLKARGIQIVKPSKQKYYQQPNAFPGNTGCQPPKGWKG